MASASPSRLVPRRQVVPPRLGRPAGRAAAVALAVAFLLIGWVVAGGFAGDRIGAVAPGSGGPRVLRTGPG